MRTMVLSVVALLVGCTSERWIYAPTASEVISVPEGTLVVEGEAVLSYDREGVPSPDVEVSNALRLEVASSVRETPAIEFPAASERDLTRFEDASALNLLGVYQDCGEARCEVVVPFRVTRSTDAAAEIEVSGDAILTVENVVHDVSAESDAARLQIVIY